VSSRPGESYSDPGKTIFLFIKCAVENVWKFKPFLYQAPRPKAEVQLLINQGGVSQIIVIEPRWRIPWRNPSKHNFDSFCIWRRLFVSTGQTRPWSCTKWRYHHTKNACTTRRYRRRFSIWWDQSQRKEKEGRGLLGGARLILPGGQVVPFSQVWDVEPFRQVR